MNRHEYKRMSQVHRIDCRLAPDVERGCSFLDGAQPDWFERIDIGTLEMANTHSCICGQVFLQRVIDQAGAYKCSDGYDYFVHEFDTNGVKLGFDIPSREYGDGCEPAHRYLAFAILATLWIEQIEKRRANAGTMFREDS
jgi:hypothetical protein